MRLRKVFEQKSGDAFGRFQRAGKKMLSVPKEEIDNGKLSISGQKVG